MKFALRELFSRKFWRVAVLARIAGFVSGLILLLIAWSFLHEFRLIMAQPLTSWTEDVSADCGVVLTGGPNRIREGIDLLARRDIQKLIISGVHAQATLREIFAPLPFYGDLREQDVILERRSRTTYGNAQQTLPIVEALRCRDVVLITSRSHMRRALGTFRAEFPASIALIPRSVVSYSVEPTPSEAAIEAVKSMFYSLWAY